MNWMGIGFVMLWLIGLPTYMIIMLVHERRAEKRKNGREA